MFDFPIHQKINCSIVITVCTLTKKWKNVPFGGFFFAKIWA